MLPVRRGFRHVPGYRGVARFHCVGLVDRESDVAARPIDTRTELLIQQAVEKISAGRTSIIIAHRLSTIKHVNKVMVFEKGEVIEEGSIHELLGRESKFKKLYELQNKAEILEDL